MEWIKMYFIGIVILVVAIGANIIAAYFGIKTWYDFLEGIGNGLSLTMLDIVWLFILYPLILGLSVELGRVLF